MSSKKAKQVWVVGQWLGEAQWDLSAIRSSKEEAIKCCRDDTYFIGPVLLDGPQLPHEQVIWEGCYYPLLKSESNKKRKRPNKVLRDAKAKD